MIPHYDYLQQAAYRIRTDVPWQRQLFLLRFPEKWKNPLTALVPRRRDGKEIRSVPVSLLNQVITALVPDVITVARKAAIGESAPWIYSDVDVDAESLFAIIATWVRATAKTPDLAAAVLKAMSPADLRAPGWEPLDVDFSQLTTATGGDPIASVQLYRLLPHVLAADLAAPGAVHEHLLPENPDLEADVDEDTAQMVHAHSEFRRCPAGEGAEVVSWPPHYPTRKPVSFLLRLTAQSHAFSADATVHLRASVRRWAHKDVRLSYDRAHTVYLLPALPWLPGLRNSRSFLTAPSSPGKRKPQTQKPVSNTQPAGAAVGKSAVSCANWAAPIVSRTLKTSRKPPPPGWALTMPRPWFTARACTPASATPSPQAPPWPTRSPSSAGSPTPCPTIWSLSSR